MVWYSHLFKNFPQFVVIHTVKVFGLVSSRCLSGIHLSEVDVCLEFTCFLYGPADVGNLVSGSSAFSKSCLYIRKFLKPNLKDFEHYLANM